MKLCDHIWLLESSRAQGNVPGFHCYLVKDSEGLTMIDTSLPGRNKAIREEIESLGFEIGDLKRIFLTHTDIDHIGNALLDGIDRPLRGFAHLRLLRQHQRDGAAGRHSEAQRQQKALDLHNFPSSLQKIAETGALSFPAAEKILQKRRNCRKSPFPAEEFMV